MRSRNLKIVQFILFLLLLSIFLFNTSTITKADTIDLTGYKFVAFVADGYDHGELYNVKNWLQQRGGTDFTIAGLEKIVTHSGGDIETDILISEVNVSEYDCIIIPGGEGPANLITSEEVLDQVRLAHSEVIILAAICHGPLVLAEAGVINDTYVTGYAGISGDLTNAGGIYLDVRAYVDGNIVTGNTAIYYKEFCYCIAKALGCLENTPPVLEESAFEHLESQFSDILNIRVKITDDNTISQVTAHLYAVISSHTYLVNSYDLENEGNNHFNGSFTISGNGTYSVDIYAVDMYYNFITYENLTSLEVEVEKRPIITEPENTEESSFLGLLSLSLILPIIAKLNRKRKKIV